MDRRQGFSLLLVPLDSDERQVREIRLSGMTLVGMAATAVAVAMIFVAMVASYGFVSVDQIRYQRLQRENRVLQGQLSNMDRTIQNLADQMAVIAQRDEAVRLYAELEPLSEDLRRAGIGGSHRDFDRQVLLAGGAGAGDTKRLQEKLNQLTREAKLEMESLLEVKAKLEASQTFLKGYPSIWPIDTSKYRTYVSSSFGTRDDPLYGGAKFHYGNDIVAAHGTPVRATADGTVEDYEKTVTGFKRIGLGNFVRLSHGNGYVTAYGHMSRLASHIRRGVRVKRGEIIGYVGNTGRSQGTHLHYEILESGKPQNPWFFYYGDRIAGSVGASDLSLYRDRQISP